MANHPNRSGDGPFRNPEPTEVKAARERAGLTIEQAAALIYTSAANWTSWELPRGEAGCRRMHPAFWHLFRVRIGADLPKWEPFNLNTKVRAKLAPGSRDYLDRGGAYAAVRAGIGGGPYPYNIDSDGYTEFMLWDFMREFGPQMHLGVPQLYTEANTIELLKETP